MPLLPVLASQAGEAYRKGNYAECLEVLAKLQAETAAAPMGEGETKLLHNLTLAEFARDNCKNPKTIMKRLSEILHAAGYNTKLEKRARRLVPVPASTKSTKSATTGAAAASTGSAGSAAAGSGAGAPADATSGVAGGSGSGSGAGGASNDHHHSITRPGVALALYNLATLLHQSRHTAATMNHLETIFEHMADLDDLIVLRACLLLLELYSMVLRECTCLQSQRAMYLERANQVIDFCASKRSLDGLSLIHI